MIKPPPNRLAQARSRLTSALAGAFGLLLFPPQLVSDERLDRITFNEQELFVSGGNVAWINFARDIGPGRTDIPRFERIFHELNENGGNVMRLWLHADGRYTPEWNGRMVVGPGEGAISDLRDILDAAHQHDVALILCLWSFDMLRLTNGDRLTDRARAILTQAENRRSYIDKALIPMVRDLKDHPAIFAWEIFNEPEGMSHEFGWNGIGRISMKDIQQFVNQAAGAIRRTAPGILITNGAWSFQALTDVLEGKNTANYYTDKRLVEAGGDPQGTLDFYTMHYYSWARETLSPFHNDASHWRLDKPVVVAEFYTKDDLYGVAKNDLYSTLYDRGYAGALGWQWVDHAHNREANSDSWPVILHNLRTMKKLHPEAVDLSISRESKHISEE